MSSRRHDLTIQRRLRQSPAQTFRSFADPQLKRRWFGAPDGWTDLLLDAVCALLEPPTPRKGS